jgi:hypothetical protein
MLILFAACTYVWQIIACVAAAHAHSHPEHSMCLLLTVWWTPSTRALSVQVFGSENGLFGVAIANIALAFPVAFFYSGLLGFHSYLQYRNSTTYGFFIERDAARRAARKAKAARDKPVSAVKSGLDKGSGGAGGNGNGEAAAAAASGNLQVA